MMIFRPEAGRPKTEDRRLKTEDRSPKTEDQSPSRCCFGASLLAKSGTTIDFIQFSYFGIVTIATASRLNFSSGAAKRGLPRRQGGQSVGNVGAKPSQYYSPSRAANLWFVGACIPSTNSLLQVTSYRLQLVTC